MALLQEWSGSRGECNNPAHLFFPVILSDYRRQANQILADYKHVARQVKEERLALSKAQEQLAVWEESQVIVQQVAQTIQQHAHSQMASVVSKCLAAIFEDPYEFRIIFEKKRGQTEARLVFYRNGKERNPMTTSGGGVIDVAAFALRVASLVLSQPNRRRVLVLDEPFKALKPPEVYGPRVSQMMLTLSKEFNIQFIVVQNLLEYQVGTIIEVE